MSPPLTGTVTPFRSQQDRAITFGLARFLVPEGSWDNVPQPGLCPRSGSQGLHLSPLQRCCSAAGPARAHSVGPLPPLGRSSSTHTELWAGQLFSQVGPAYLHLTEILPANCMQVTAFFIFTFISYFPSLLLKYVFGHFNGNLEMKLLLHVVRLPGIPHGPPSFPGCLRVPSLCFFLRIPASFLLS